MKKHNKPIGAKSIGNRTIIGIICIVAALAIKNRQNFGFIGYKDGENKYTFPKYGRAKAEALLDKLCAIADSDPPFGRPTLTVLICSLYKIHKHRDVSVREF